MSERTPVIRRRQEVPPVPCPCGKSQRLITSADSPRVGLHVTHICCGQAHYHQRTDEVYYILQGEGFLDLDGERHAVSPGTAVFIPAGVKHRGEGDFTAVIVTQPAFDPEDEFMA